MSEILKINNYIPAMSDKAIDKVCQLEHQALQMPQTPLPTSQLLHGGIYARTIKIPAMTLITGALIKIATTLIINGDALAFIGNDTIELKGYNILPASAHRKQAFVAKTETYLTMIFPTLAKTVEEAEEEFTDDAHLLLSRIQIENNHIMITGE